MRGLDKESRVCSDVLMGGVCRLFIESSSESSPEQEGDSDSAFAGSVRAPPALVCDWV